MTLSFSEVKEQTNKSQINEEKVTEGPNDYKDKLKELYHQTNDGSYKWKSLVNLKEPGPDVESTKSDTEEKKPKHVIISDDIDEDANVETTALRRASLNSDDLIENSLASKGYLTLSGTIKRGKKKVQNVEVVLNMSREELEVLEANLAGDEKKFKCKDGRKNEKRPLGCRITVPPILILLYPLFIIGCSVGLGLFAGFRQISWKWDSWRKEFVDFEKGFFLAGFVTFWICPNVHRTKSWFCPV